MAVWVNVPATADSAGWIAKDDGGDFVLMKAPANS